MPNNKCCVSGCLNCCPKATEGTSWHSFPKNKNLAKEWMANVGINISVARNALDCSAHFREKNFKISPRTGNRILLSKVVPSAFQRNGNTKVTETISSNCFEPRTNCEDKNHPKIDDNLMKTNAILRSKLLSVQNELKTLQSVTLENEKLNEKVTKIKKKILSFVKRNNETQENFVTETQSTLEIDVKPDKKLFHLPLDIWDIILGYFSLDEITTLSSVCKYLQAIVQTIKHSFDFSHYYSLNVDCLLNYTLSTTCSKLDLNHCYWIKPNEILQIISKTSLEHIYVIECNINKDCVNAICNLCLTSLSITYTEDWQIYIQEHYLDYIKALRTLKSFTIFYKKSFFLEGRNIVEEVHVVLRRHCKQLEHLKIFDCSSKFYISDRDDLSTYVRDTTPVPNLKSLIININNLKYERDIENFVADMLNDKVIPLEYVDFGNQTGYLFQNNILQGRQINWDKSPLVLSCLKTDFNFWLNFPQVQNLIYQQNHKIITTKNIELKGFSEFARRVVTSSGKILKEIHINESKIYKNLYNEYLEGLLHIALNSPQITVVDLLGVEEEDTPYLISLDRLQKHEAIIEALANLKNLQKLIISPQLLHCKFADSNGKECKSAPPFWKVTKGCKQLIEIRIVCDPKCFGMTYTIHQDSLYAIAHCAKLRVLYLVNFSFISDHYVFHHLIISKLTKNCTQLQELYMYKLYLTSCTLFEENLNLAKKIKILNISQDTSPLNITKNFLDNLNSCTMLEKLFINKIQISDEHCEELAEAFLKLCNLQVVVIDSGLKRSENKAMDTVLSKIEKERPAFFCSLSEHRSKLLKSLPLVHFDLIYPIMEYF